MAFSTKNAKNQVMSAAVRDWSLVGEPDETRTLVATLSSGADVLTLERELRTLGVEIVSSGPAVFVVTISRKNTSEVSDFPSVARLDMPTRYEPNSLDDNGEPTDQCGWRDLRTMV